MALRPLMLLAALLVLTTPPPAGAGSCPLGGSGTSGDPWQIADCEDLGILSDGGCSLSGDYMLVNDIDFEECMPEDPGFGYPGFSPIGGFDTPFTGTFNGSGHTISNLFIWMPAGEYIGMFGVIGPGGVVFDLELEGVDISGMARVGGLVGLNYGHIQGVTVSGEVVGHNVEGFGSTGGLAGASVLGEAPGSIVDCHSSADVTGTIFVGGLVGINADIIIDCSATGSVTGVPGSPPLIDGVTEVESYDPVDEYGSVFIGGLVGCNGAYDEFGFLEGIIVSSFATGRVEGSFYVGGLAGGNLADEMLVLTGTESEVGLTEHGGPDISGEGLLSLLFGEQPEEVSGMLEAEKMGAGGMSAEEMMGLAGVEMPPDIVPEGGIGAAEVPPLPEDFSVILDAYSRGDVDAFAFGGGFSGLNLGVMEYTYSTGSVSGYAHIAGHTAMNALFLIASLSTGGVDAEAGMDCPSVGGFAGINYGLIVYCYYNRDGGNPASCIGTDESMFPPFLLDVPNCTAIDDNEEYFFDVADTSPPYDVWDFEYAWDTVFDDACYPPLRWEGIFDGDGDGYAAEGGLCPSDCDDSLGTVNPGASERCSNNRDDDCDGRTDCRDRECKHHNDCEEGGEVVTYMFGAGGQAPAGTGQPPAPPAPPVGAPEIDVDGHAAEGDVVEAIVTDADGDPATGEVTVTKPDGTVITLPIVDGKVQIPLDQPGVWTITYVDSEGRTAMQTISVSEKAAEPMDSPPEREKTAAPEEPEVIEMVPAAVAGGTGGSSQLPLIVIGLLIALAAVFVLRRDR